MGYNTWYEMGTGLSETAVLAQAQLMASDGLQARGYNTITLDAGWEAPGRTGVVASTAGLTWDTTKFPHGIPWLASQLHALGFKFGIYTTIGATGCGAGIPGSYGHYSQDAATFASWGVNFVKVDDCKGLPAGTTFAQETALFKQFGAYIEADGMTYSEELPVLQPVGSASYETAVAASSVWAGMWRVAPDEHWNDSATYTILGHLADDLNLHGYAYPGHWNDLDMLVPGVVDGHPFGWTLADEQSQLSVWAMEASPLFLSTNIAKLTAPELTALENPDMISIDQSGAQAPLSVLNGSIQAVVKGADGGMAVMLVNNGTKAAHGAFTLAQLHVRGTHLPYKNIWTGLGGTLSGVSVSLPPGATELLLVIS
jgi:alpha-galactosidase